MNATTKKQRRSRDGDEDVHLVSTSLHRSGRETGAWVYLDGHTLREAMTFAGLDSRDLSSVEVMRYWAKGSGGRASILIHIRKRKPAGTLAASQEGP